MKKTAVFLISLLSLSYIYGVQVAEAHVAINTSPTTSCNLIDSTDYTTHAINQIDSRISLVASSTGLSLYTNRDFSLSTNPWTRNPNSWTQNGTPLDFTGVAGYHIAGGSNSNFQLGTLISPRHFITANHFHASTGDKLGFIDASGNRVERTVTGGMYVSPSSDIWISSLDSDVPDSITYYPIIASSTLMSLIGTYTPRSFDVPMVFFDQEAKAQIHSIYSLDNQNIEYGMYTSGIRAPFSELIISGDSANPEFILVDNQPVLLSATYGGGGGSAPLAGAYISQINAAMNSLGGGYQVTEYNPTCFIKYPVNHLPAFTNDSWNGVITYEHTSSTVPIKTYQTTDADAGQTSTFTLDSLTSNATTTILNPSDYFSINSTTGELFQIHDIHAADFGANLTLNVKATDNGMYPSSRILFSNINVRTVLHQNGRIILDPNFHIPTINGNASAVLLGPGDKMTLTGVFDTVDGTPQSSITRINTDGTLDTSFATNIGTGFNAYGQLVNLYSSYKTGAGKIVSTTADFSFFKDTLVGGISRLNEDGTLDTSFNVVGSSTTCLIDGLVGCGISQEPNSSPGIADIADVHGKTLLVGNFNDYNGTPIPKIILLNEDGSLDTPFLANMGDGINNGGYGSLAYDGDSHFYISGLVNSYTDASHMTTTVHRIAKFNIDGTFDQTFNTNIGTGPTLSVIPYQIRVRPDGKIVVVGAFTKFNGVDARHIALLNPDGTLDMNFMANTGTGFDDYVSRIFPQLDNKIIITGQFSSYNGKTINGIIRLNADGTEDTLFNNALGNGISGNVYSAATRSDGALITVGGQDYNGSFLNYSLATFITETPSAPSSLSLLSGTDLGASSTDGITATTTQIISGTGSTSAAVYVYEGSTLLATTTVPDSGYWTATTTLADGVHSIKAIQALTLTTTATSSTSTDFLVIVDTVKPQYSNPYITSQTIVVPMNKNMNSYATSSVSDWTVTINGNVVNVSSVSVSSANITLTITSPINYGGNASLSYTTRSASDSIQDYAGNFLNSFTAGGLINNTPAPVVQNTGGGGGGGGGGGSSPGIIYYNRATTTVGTINQIQTTNTITQAEAATVLKGITVTLGASSQQVVMLQKYLNSKGFPVSVSGAGSKGKESSYFGAKTKQALIKFQKAVGIKPASGIFGPITKKYMLSHL